MQFTLATVAAILATTVSAAPKVHKVAHNDQQVNATTVTTTVKSYVTFCPEATTFALANVTYTATASELVTVTHCPDDCTVSYNPAGPTSIIPLPASVVASVTSAASSTYSPAAAGSNSTSSGSSSNGPAVVGSNSTGSGSSSNSPAVVGSGNTYHGSAASVAVGSAAALAAVFGFVAFAL